MLSLHRVVHQMNTTTCDNATISPSPIYSTPTEPSGKHTEEEQLAGYSAINDTATYAAADTNIACDDGLDNHTHNGPTAPPTVGDTDNAGYSIIVYGGMVRQDGIKTTVKTTAQIDEQQQQSVSDRVGQGLYEDCYI